MPDFIENEHIKIWLRSGIIDSEYSPNLHITLQVAKKIIEDRLKVSSGVSYPCLADIRNLKRVNDDAREYLAGEEACQLITALAVLTNTPIQNLFANFYLKFNKPKVKTMLFTDKEKALRWLELFRYHQQN